MGYYGKNIEGYADPTASVAMGHVAKEEKAEREADERVGELVKVLKYIIRKSGFELGERMVLVDKRTGRVYK